MIDGYSLIQHVNCPTHQSGNILDHILSSDRTLSLKDVTVADVGLSDHCLIKCNIAVDITRQPIIRATFINWKKLDLDMFRQRVRSSSVYLRPASTVDEFAGQLESDLTKILDDLAPVCTSTKRRGKSDSRRSEER